MCSTVPLVQASTHTSITSSKMEGMHCGLTVVAWQLADVNPGDGGLCLIPGSHKGNLPCPPEMKRYEMYQEHIRQVTGKAGDVVIFTEATTHGNAALEGRPINGVLCFSDTRRAIWHTPKATSLIGPSQCLKG